MKLKKIVSLALAGILAVSMLTACGDNSSNNGGASSGNTTPSSSYTDAILSETKAATKLVLSTSNNDKLDKAVEYAAKSNFGTASNSFARIEKTGAYYTLANTVMDATDVSYTDNGNEDNLAAKINDLDKDGTVYTMYKVSRLVSDEFIENELVDLVNHWASMLDEDTDDTTYEYTIRIAKADSLAGKDADRSKDTVVIGVAITVDETAVKY